MVKNIRTIVLIIVGVISIGLSIRCFTFGKLGYEEKMEYGGDAFTGIQNATAKTSQNVVELAKIAKFGFGSVLLVVGLSFLGIGLTSPIQNSENNDGIMLDETKSTDQTSSEEKRGKELEPGGESR